MIAIIILNWNNAPDTLECLASVMASKGVFFEVYVVDNGSTDGSLETIEQAYPTLHYVRNGANLGFAEGNNRGMQEALKKDPTYLFLLNNDAILDQEALRILKETAEQDPTSAIFGPKIYFYDEPATIWYGGGDWDPARASFYHRNWNTREEESAQRGNEKTGYVCGCALFIRASTVREGGMMDPRFFLNWEEIDWCWRLKKLGFECLYVPKAKCWHKISRSFIEGKKGAMWLYFYWRNRLFWMEKHLCFSERHFFMRTILWPQIWTHLKQAIWGEGAEKKGSRGALEGVRDYVLRRFGAKR